MINFVYCCATLLPACFRTRRINRLLKRVSAKKLDETKDARKEELQNFIGDDHFWENVSSKNKTVLKMLPAMREFKQEKIGFIRNGLKTGRV